MYTSIYNFYMCKHVLRQYIVSSTYVDLLLHTYVLSFLINTTFLFDEKKVSSVRFEHFKMKVLLLLFGLTISFASFSKYSIPFILAMQH